MHLKFNHSLLAFSVAGLFAHNSLAEPVYPAEKFDLGHWKITLPMDLDKNGKVDEIDVAAIQQYRHEDYFYVDQSGLLVFQAPNKAVTTVSSTNTRSELRQMLRGTNKKIKTKAPGNNFALQAHTSAEKFGATGGILQATLKVNHVARNAQLPEKFPAYSVVVGQIHAGKDKQLMKDNTGFGWGNEPLKIYYKKWPEHDTGSVFWTYERNLEKDNPDRTDIAYPVWGNTWENSQAPGDKGIALGEFFSYEVNVKGNIMHLTFEAEGHPKMQYEINLADNVDAYGKVDDKDNPAGYAGDWHYFKAGAYNQCSVKDREGFWYAGCEGTGDWKTDKENGDYVSVSFAKLVLLPPASTE
ncbi:polysaccharide lyase family 7 protein [Planctobacterium marinum]|uniref:Alginate lyase 2 domain-containing protein n=1 Tax=Planctobacterium marinum TaxID=1631968 RepID=A0AA48HMZ2_9ALTE|nr:hypothetical protein MACH26_09780 [Planctobacterium marinum]